MLKNVFLLIAVFDISFAALGSTPREVGGYFLKSVSDWNRTNWNETAINVSLVSENINNVYLPSNFSNVIALSIQRCLVSNANLARIMQLSFSNTSSVEHVTFHHCHLDTNTLSKVLTSSPGNDVLTALDLSFSPNLDARAYRILSAITSKMTSLTSLAMNGNKLSPEDTRALVHTARRHPSLCRLSLSACDLADDHVGYLGFCLKSNQNISHLDLSMNAITAEGVSHLTEAFKAQSGKRLVQLDLSYNPIGDSGVNALARCLEANLLPNLRDIKLKQVLD